MLVCTYIYILILCEHTCSTLQENLIRSHAAGVGPPLSPMRTRMLLVLRINVLVKGCRLAPPIVRSIHWQNRALSGPYTEGIRMICVISIPLLPNLPFSIYTTTFPYQWG